MDIELELKKMKKELKSALDAEEKSRKAMDELASVLREVAAEASKAKEDLKSTQLELKAAKEEKEQMGLKLTTSLAECKTLKNAEERIRMEASIVRGENLKLKDQLAEKDTALNFISRELESLRASEAAARRSLADLKLQLFESSSESSNAKTRYMEKQEEIKPMEYKKVKKTFSFDMRCSGRNKGLEDMVDRKVTKVARGARGGSQDGASSMRRDMSYRFPDEGRRSSERQNSLRKKAFFKRFGELVSSSKSRTQ